MNNTDKLLRAFIEASGFEINESSNIQRMYKRDDIMSNGEPKENAMPETISKTVDYKVTKRDVGTQELIDIIEDAQTVLPNNAVYTWDNLQKVILFLEGFGNEKD